MFMRTSLRYANFLKAQNIYCACPKFVRTRQYFDSMKRACVLIAPGSEEMETIITVDVLRRAGLTVDLTTVQSLSSPVECSRQVIVVPDVDIAEALNSTYDIVILPGGLKGSEAFAKSTQVQALLKKQETEKKYIAAICAAPTALVAHSICVGKVMTCYPSMADTIRNDGRYKYAECEVVIDDKLITSRGPGTAISFALKIVEKMVGIDKAREVARAMLVCCYPECTKIGE